MIVALILLVRPDFPEPDLIEAKPTFPEASMFQKLRGEVMTSREGERVSETYFEVIPFCRKVELERRWLTLAEILPLI